MTENISAYHLERLGPHLVTDQSTIPLRIGANTIGRLPTNDIVLSSKYVSRRHCTINLTETGQVTVKNDVTTNGIFVSGTQHLSRDDEICLDEDDSLGIGCDTSKNEIVDAECFIFKLKRNKIESNQVDEIILLDDSDEEEECRIQEEYSQMNISEMKQEYMELEDFVEEYARMSSIKSEPDAEFVPVDILPSESVEETKANIDAGDVFEQIIANSSKSYTEKMGLIKNVVPDVSFILMKDCTVGGDGEVPLSKETKHTKKGTKSDTRREKETKSKTKRESERKKTNEETKKSKGGTEKEETKKESSRRKRNERKLTEEKSSVAKDKSDTKNSYKVVTKVDNTSSPHIRKLHVTISIPNLNTVIQPTPTTPSSCEPMADSIEQTTRDNLNKSTTAIQSRISNRRNTSVPTSSSPSHKTNSSVKPVEATHSRITHRRNTFVPSSTLSSGPTKRQLEIINAPHLLKRRKSISAMPETYNPPSKNVDNKWLSKKVVHKGRSKEEIKSRLAALVPDPKDKVVEAKVIRSNTKIPVKNTHKTRSDQLTDTIVKTITPPTRKHKMSENNLPPEICKKLRMTEDEIAKEKPKIIQLRRPSIIAEKETEKCAEVRPCDLSVHHHGSNNVANIPSDLNDTSDHTRATSPVIKSILKKSSKPIQKRRVTVTFADEPRIKIITNTTATSVVPIAVPVRNEEDNIDDVIHNIMSVGMSALKGSSGASINGKNFSYKTVADEYESLRHLQNVFIPLMKAELWKEIEDGYAQSKNTPETYIKVNFCSRDESHPNRFKYHCESQSAAAIQNGALVLLFSVNSGKEFLGYIINRQIANKNCYFQFVTPYSMQETTCTPAPFKLKQIMYIRPNLKVFDALFQLKNSPLIKHILHPKQNCLKPPKKPVTYKGHNSLNQDQMITLKEVYRKCISGHPFISLIEGPPGTGKSRLITNLVLQFLYGKEMPQPVKILVCAPSNAAVDILTKNLMEVRKKYLIEKGQKKMKLVRFGVLEKMDVAVRGVSIQGLTSQNAKTVLIERNKLMECKKKKEAELAIYTTKNHKEKIQAIRNEIATIEVKSNNVTYDEKCLLEGANVICTTLNSCCALSSKISSMDICIIDEATQCNEPASLIPLQFGVKSLILVGDTKQLPSTVVSDIAKQYNYDQSLFQRLQKSFESANKFEDQILKLTTQYRMHPDILHWPNEFFYKSQLVSDDSTNASSLKLKPYTVFNLNCVQSAHTGQKHISNVDEAKFVCNLLNFLLTKADPRIYSYGIISAYSQQKNDLAKALSLTHSYATVNTIDSCQGQERDIVIISIARTRGIGFLAIRQRLNVALTRAKKMLILCGNFNSLRSHPMWTSLLDDARKRNVYVHLPTMDDSLLCSYFEQTLTLTT